MRFRFVVFMLVVSLHFSVLLVRLFIIIIVAINKLINLKTSLNDRPFHSTITLMYREIRYLNSSFLHHFYNCLTSIFYLRKRTKARSILELIKEVLGASWYHVNYTVTICPCFKRKGY